MDAEKPKRQKYGGRVKGAKNKKARELERALKRNTNVDEIIQALFRLATGVNVVKMTKEGQELFYTEKPDREAADILLSHRYGKPTQKIEEELTHNFNNLTPEELQKLPSNVLNLIAMGKPINAKRLPVSKN